jgi:hypothetical protein
MTTTPRPACTSDACGQLFGGKRNSFKTGADHPLFVDLTGKHFGRWIVEGRAPTSAGKSRWECRCACGTRRFVESNSLKSGKSQSCGCHAREVARAVGDRTRTHGKRKTSTYNVWVSMIQRCHNPKNAAYGRYGAAGILVCDRWRFSFESFLADMGERPQALSLDRVDNSGGYSKENCRWATAAQQSRNSRTAKMVSIEGKTQCLIDWLREISLTKSSYLSRLRRGWTQERALTTPPDRRFDWVATRETGHATFL